MWKLVRDLNPNCCLSKTSYPFESPETNGKTISNPPVHQLVRSDLQDLPSSFDSAQEPRSGRNATSETYTQNIAQKACSISSVAID